MDYDLPEELADYLPKPRQGFQLLGSPPQRPSNVVVTKKVIVRKKPQITKPTTKKSSLNQKVPGTRYPAPKRNVNVQTKKNPNVGTKKVQTVYPKKGKILSKVPESKWKEVRAGPREDPNVVRTEEEEIQIFLKYTNDFRRKNNLNSLELSDELSEIARGHNNNMMEGKTPVGHEGFKDRAKQVKRKFLRVSENCAMYVGPREHLQTLFENLCNSTKHRQNLLGEFNTIGMSIGKNSENMWYVTQFFALFPEKQEKKDDDVEEDDE